MEKKICSYTARYTKIQKGYMGQLVDWPEVITEGNTIEKCRELLKDVLREMMLSYQEKGFEIPSADILFDQILIEV